MTGRTHAAFGAAVAIALVHPSSPVALPVVAVAAVAGSLLPDIDSKSSSSHKLARQIARTSAVIIGSLALAERFFRFGIWNLIHGQKRIEYLLPAVIVLVFLLWYGYHQPHRGVMHSFLSVIIFSLLIRVIVKPAALPFCIGMLSHIGLDLLNRSKVRLLFPEKAGWALNLCSADGAVNDAIFGLSVSAMALECIDLASNLTV